MTRYIYSVWFEDQHAVAGDQDREWVACIGIEADTSIAAQQWGDALAKARCARVPSDIFLRSHVDNEMTIADVNDLTTLPRIFVGEHASDKLIGW